jgi:hypothetical protein
MSNSNIQAVTKTADGHAIAGRTRVAVFTSQTPLRLRPLP